MAGELTGWWREKGSEPTDAHYYIPHRFPGRYISLCEMRGFWGGTEKEQTTNLVRLEDGGWKCRKCRLVLEPEALEDEDLKNAE